MMDQDLNARRSTIPLLAALPPALYGLLLSLCVLGVVPLRTIVRGGRTPLPRPLLGQTIWIPAAMLGLLILLLTGGALAGLARRRAAWSHTWSAAAVVAVAMTLSIMADDVPYLLSPALDVLLLVALVLILAAVSLVAARRSITEAALVSMGFVSAFSLTVAFVSVASPMLRMDIALGVAPAGLVFSLLIAAFLRWRGEARWIALLLAATLAAALLWIYAAAVASAMSPDIAWGTFMRTLGSVAAIGFVAPLALAGLLSLRRSPALQSA